MYEYVCMVAKFSSVRTPLNRRRRTGAVECADWQTLAGRATSQLAWLAQCDYGRHSE